MRSAILIVALIATASCFNWKCLEAVPSAIPDVAALVGDLTDSEGVNISKVITDLEKVVPEVSSIVKQCMSSSNQTVFLREA